MNIVVAKGKLSLNTYPVAEPVIIALIIFKDAFEKFVLFV